MSYTVKLITASGEQRHKFTVDKNENILTAGLRAGASLPYSCRGGCCGSCEAKLISGDVTYKNGEPVALTGSANAILCQAYAESDVTLVTQERVVADIEPRLLPVRIHTLEKLTDDVMLMTLQLPPNQTLEYRPGQYLDFILSGQKRRSFSMANAPDDSGKLQLHIRKVDDGWFTGQVFESFKPKQVMRIEAPLGQFFLRSPVDTEVLMVAGGTGYAPIRALLQQLLPVTEQPVKLYWGVRAEADFYAKNELTKLQQQYANFKVIPVYSEQAPAAERQGWVTDAVTNDYPDMSNLTVYMAGPPPMVTAGREAFAKNKLDNKCLFIDSFEFAPQ